MRFIAKLPEEQSRNASYHYVPVDIFSSAVLKIGEMSHAQLSSMTYFLCYLTPNKFSPTSIMYYLIFIVFIIGNISLKDEITNETNNVVFVCHLTKGRNFSWYLNGEKKKEKSNVFQINNVDRKSNGNKVTCMGDSENRTHIAKAKLTVYCK